MKVSLDKSHIKDVETGIVPYMAKSITLPVLIDGKECGVVMYLVDMMSSAISKDTTLEKVAKELAKII